MAASKGGAPVALSLRLGPLVGYVCCDLAHSWWLHLCAAQGSPITGVAACRAGTATCSVALRCRYSCGASPCVGVAVTALPTWVAPYCGDCTRAQRCACIANGHALCEGVACCDFAHAGGVMMAPPAHGPGLTHHGCSRVPRGYSHSLRRLAAALLLRRVALRGRRRDGSAHLGGAVLWRLHARTALRLHRQWPRPAARTCPSGTILTVSVVPVHSTTTAFFGATLSTRGLHLVYLTSGTIRPPYGEGSVGCRRVLGAAHMVRHYLPRIHLEQMV